LLADGHGSTRQLVTGNGSLTVAGQYNYDAYGQTLGAQPTYATPPATRVLYTGQQFDPALQQYYLRARYYDQSNGRFNQPDSYAGTSYDPQSLHKYEYAYDDPVNAVDPTGHNTLVELAILNVLLVTLVALVTVRLLNTQKNVTYLLRTKTGAWLPGDNEKILEINRRISAEPIRSQIRATGNFALAFNVSMDVLVEKGVIRQQNMGQPEAKGIAFMFALVSSSFMYHGPLTEAEQMEAYRRLADAYPDDSISLPGTTLRSQRDGFTHFYAAALGAVVDATGGRGTKVIGYANEAMSYVLGHAYGTPSGADIYVNDLGVGFGRTLIPPE
jgi:RHS repeat-associated protein